MGISREEFIEHYCLRSKISWDDLKKVRRPEPCDCGEEICKGWIMVPIDEDDENQISASGAGAMYDEGK